MDLSLVSLFKRALEISSKAVTLPTIEDETQVYLRAMNTNNSADLDHCAHLGIGSFRTC